MHDCWMLTDQLGPAQVEDEAGPAAAVPSAQAGEVYRHLEAARQALAQQYNVFPHTVLPLQQLAQQQQPGGIAELQAVVGRCRAADYGAALLAVLQGQALPAGPLGLDTGASDGQGASAGTALAGVGQQAQQGRKQQQGQTQQQQQQQGPTQQQQQGKGQQQHVGPIHKIDLVGLDVPACACSFHYLSIASRQAPKGQRHTAAGQRTTAGSLSNGLLPPLPLQ